MLLDQNGRLKNYINMWSLLHQFREIFLRYMPYLDKINRIYVVSLLTSECYDIDKRFMLAASSSFFLNDVFVHRLYFTSWTLIRVDVIMMDEPDQNLTIQSLLVWKEPASALPARLSGYECEYSMYAPSLSHWQIWT